MPLFQFSQGKAKRIAQKEFPSEKELHELIDDNLGEIFNLRYIKDEHITAKHGRIETLAIDESNRPVVIEYKKIKESGQLTQANRYMTWIRQNPDSFELLVKKNIKGFKGEIDFSNPRILCFAQEFSIDDKCLALALNAELYKYRYYDNEVMTIIREEEPEQLIQSTPTGKPSIKKIDRKPKKAKSIEGHLEGSSSELIELFWEFNNRVLNISDEVGRYTTNQEIIYKTSLNFACFAIRKNKNLMSILLRTSDGKIKDPLRLAREIPKSHGWGRMTHQVFIPAEKVTNEEYVNEVMDLVFQAYSSTQ